MYSEKETHIYRFWNGCFKDGKPVFQWVDPIEVQINLEEHDPNFATTIKTLFDLIQISNDANAAKDLVDLGRIMFKLPAAYDDGERVQGHTTEGVMNIISDYIIWIGDIKKNIEDTPILPLVTESVEDQTTSVSVDSGYISQDK